jgi:hypothetical protein
MQNNDTIFLRLIANHNCFKHKKIINKNEYLKLYIQSKFDTDLHTINNLINYIENIVKDINLEKFIIQTVLEETINKIENASIH